MKHSDYPYKFNDTAIFFPMDWKEDWNTVETVNQSEAGTDIVTVKRYGKLRVSVSCEVSSKWLKIFQSFSKMDNFTLSRYDAVDEGYVTHDVRMRGFSASRIEKSENIEISIGLWKISFTLEEF